MIQLTIQKNEAEQRLDRFLLKYLDQAGPAFLYKMLRKKNITLNGKRAEGKERLSEGDLVTLFLSEETIAKFRTPPEGHGTERKKGIPLSVLYEDDDILLIDKPAGLLSQKAKAEDLSVNEAVVDYVREKTVRTGREEAFTPSVCNRLDRNTSGLLTAGKTLAGLQFLNEQFRSRGLEKYYLAAVAGRLDKSARIGGYLKKDEASNTVTILEGPADGADRIETAVEPVSCSDRYSLVRLRLLTGKTHQLRAVLSRMGHPILGDPKYGEEQINRRVRTVASVRRQLLHSSELVFPTVSGRFAYLSGKRFTAPLPKDFAEAVHLLDLE